MTYDVAPTASTLDPQALAGLKRDARTGEGGIETVRAVAKQFESLFARMLIKSMRETSFGDGMIDSEQGDFYRDIFDQQLSVELSKGQGLGLADMLVRQLSGVDGTRQGASATQATEATGATAATTSQAEWKPSSREDFVRGLWPHAEAAGRALGVDPATIVSHAALETGWGRSLPKQADGQQSFNLFGIKTGAGWRGASAGSITTEYVAGTATRSVEDFRAYDSLGAGMVDYARLLSGSPRYAGALNTGSNVTAFAGALQRGGYATDPDYAAKLQAVATQVKAVLGHGDALKLADAAPITNPTRRAT